MLRLRVRYPRPVDLALDHEQQFRKGGLLVRVPPPPGTSQFDEVELEIVTLARSVVLPAQVVQLVEGVGVALSFDASDASLQAAVEEAMDTGETAGGPPEHEIVESDGPAGACEPSDTAAAGSATARKIHLAMHGKKEERMRIMREGDRSLHRYVLRNPGLRLEEVTFIAKMTTVSPDLLKAIAERREWVQRPEIALALVRNPKCPVPLAIALLQHLAPADLRRLAKGTSVRMPILQAARKRVVS